MLQKLPISSLENRPYSSEVLLNSGSLFSNEKSDHGSPFVGHFTPKTIELDRNLLPPFIAEHISVSSSSSCFNAKVDV